MTNLVFPVVLPSTEPTILRNLFPLEVQEVGASEGKKSLGRNPHPDKFTQTGKEES